MRLAYMLSAWTPTTMNVRSLCYRFRVPWVHALMRLAHDVIEHVSPLEPTAKQGPHHAVGRDTMPTTADLHGESAVVTFVPLTAPQPAPRVRIGAHVIPYVIDGQASKTR